MSVLMAIELLVEQDRPMRDYLATMPEETVSCGFDTVVSDLTATLLPNGRGGVVPASVIEREGL